MKTTSILILLVTLLSCVSVQAFWSIDGYQTDGNPFSEAFTTNYESALKASNSLALFSDMLTKFKEPQEQAELEVTMGIGYNQWGGQTDDRKAIEHFGKALLHDLPPTVLLQVYSLRGDSKARVDGKRAALEDYLRGLAESLRYQLPSKPTKPPQGGLYDITYSGAGDDPVTQHYRQLIEDQARGIRQFRFEEVMIRYRDILIEDAKRVSGGDAEQIRLATETAVNDKSKIPALIALLETPNPKPPATATSGTSTVSGSQVLSAETQARLKQLEDEYRFTIKDRQITVAGGIVSQERVNQITNAL